MFTVLLNKITSILDTNILIQEWYDFEVGELDGDPAAIVVPSDNESSYSTFNSNERVYAFSLKLLVSRSERTLKDVDKVMRNLVDRDRKSTRLNSSHTDISRMPSSA